MEKYLVNPALVLTNEEKAKLDALAAIANELHELNKVLHKKGVRVRK